MIPSSTTKCVFRLNALILLVAGGLLGGCQTEQTTTVNDGFGMSFTENNDSQSNDYGVNVD